ncbi:exonuclease sbcC [Geminocystis sp. NIES-3708]|uniref:hypothetical protein n=1 Tax=Geminocystis sp. NIES-3708 TaxID=1615909 RepID=UPI0005FCB4FE|nr:hypothetical protein [Geminocystis sp. NIES-3708]BAQ61479.1 exonuclease sbcC [Geminocystis sp. NIES-3708]
MARRKTGTTTGLMTVKSKVNLSLTSKATETLEIISKQTGLSKSALFENILSGTISISSHTANQVVKITGDADSLTSELTDNNTENDILSQDNDIKNKSANEAISKELEQQKQHIENLEKQVITQEKLVVEKNQANESLARELETQLVKIKALESEAKLLQKNHKNNSELISLKQNLEKKDQELNNLKAELASLNSHGKKTEEEFKKLIDDQKKTIEKLNQQIANLEKQISELNNSNQQAQETIIKYKNLQTELEIEKNRILSHNKQNKDSINSKLASINEQQKNTIYQLESRIAELETVAAIGEQTLNKWRSKIYN